MFLKELNTIEKEAFLSLSIHASEADGYVAAEEKALLDDYAQEMGMKSSDLEEVYSMEEVVDTFLKSNEHIRKVVLFETLGVLYADGVFEEKEEAFVYDLATKIGLSKEIVEEQLEMLKKYLDLVEDIMKAM